MHSQTQPLSTPSSLEEKGKEQIYLSDTLIHLPNPNVIYYLKSFSHTTKVTFVGETVKTVAVFDVGSLSYKDLDMHFCSFNPFPEWTFVPVQTLGIDNSKNLLPILYGLYKNQFRAINDLKIQLFPNHTYGLSFNFTSLKLDPIANISIQKEIKDLIPETPIKNHEYPIVLKNNMPSHDFLSSLYKDFLAYNTKNKLAYQYANSNGLCHIRAHFVNLFLEKAYGIQSFKIFKHWDPTSWRGFVEDKSWIFHCAAVFKIRDYDYWVWDPWVGNNTELLRLNQWIYRPDEPRPTHLFFTNSTITNSFKTTSAPHFMFIRSDEEINALQCVAGDAIPNRPKASLFSTSFFKTSPKSKESPIKESRSNRYRID